MIYYPQDNRAFIQTNRSNLLGNLWSTFNIDTQSNLGVIRVSPRIKLNTNGLLGCPVAFKYFDTKIWSIAGTKIYGNGGLPSSTAFTEDSSTGNATDYSSDESDMETFNGTLVAATTDELLSKASNGSGAGAWTSRDTLNTGGQHVLCYFKKFDRLYYSNLSNKIISIDTSWATADPGTDYAIQLTTDSAAYTITSMKATSSAIWIGIIDKTKEGASGKILEWDGLSSQVTNEYPLQSQGCMAILIDNEKDIPIAIDSNGILLRFNGNGFSEIGRLPITDKLLTSINDIDTERFIHPNGLMMTKDRSILALVNNLNADGTVNENFNAGMYEFILQESGFYSCHHRYSPSYTATTTITDYGQARISRVGALSSMNVYSSSDTRNGTFLCGATYFTDATNTSSGIFYDDSNDTLQKIGYLITTWIDSEGLRDIWQKIYSKYRKLLNATDKIVFKYRNTEQAHTDISITWVNTTTFTTTTDLSAYEVGDEVEITQGTGSGICAHITSLIASDVGHIVIIDETATGVTTGTAKARIQKWIKAGVINDQTSESKGLLLGRTAERIQVKVWMLFAGKDELHRFIIINKIHQPLS